MDSVGDHNYYGTNPYLEYNNNQIVARGRKREASLSEFPRALGKYSPVH